MNTDRAKKKAWIMSWGDIEKEQDFSTSSAHIASITTQYAMKGFLPSMNALLSTLMKRSYRYDVDTQTHVAPDNVEKKMATIIKGFNDLCLGYQNNITKYIDVNYMDNEQSQEYLEQEILHSKKIFFEQNDAQELLDAQKLWQEDVLSILETNDTRENVGVTSEDIETEQKQDDRLRKPLTKFLQSGIEIVKARLNTNASDQIMKQNCKDNLLYLRYLCKNLSERHTFLINIDEKVNHMSCSHEIMSMILSVALEIAYPDSMMNNEGEWRQDLREKLEENEIVEAFEAVVRCNMSNINELREALNVDIERIRERTLKEERNEKNANATEKSSENDISRSSIDDTTTLGVQEESVVSKQLQEKSLMAVINDDNVLERENSVRDEDKALADDDKIPLPSLMLQSSMKPQTAVDIDLVKDHSIELQGINNNNDLSPVNMTWSEKATKTDDHHKEKGKNEFNEVVENTIVFDKNNDMSMNETSV